MDTPYHLSVPTVNATITGRFLAHSPASAVARAFRAADLHTGAVQLVQPTMVQAAYLAGTSTTYARQAALRLAERAAIENGTIPLMPPARAIPRANGLALAVLGPELDDSMLVSIAHAVGPERMLAAAVSAEAHH
jgi:hypothetical protein